MFSSAYQIRKCINGWLQSFEDVPQTLEELIEFNKDHADREFTAGLSSFSIFNESSNSSRE